MRAFDRMKKIRSTTLKDRKKKRIFQLLKNDWDANHDEDDEDSDENEE